MTTNPTLKRHAALLDDMATAVGVDLEQAALSAQLRLDQVADAVLACTGCSAPEHCAGWVAQPAPVTAPPGYCRNRALLMALQPDG